MSSLLIETLFNECDSDDEFTEKKENRQHGVGEKRPREDSLVNHYNDRKCSSPKRQKKGQAQTITVVTHDDGERTVSSDQKPMTQSPTLRWSQDRQQSPKSQRQRQYFNNDTRMEYAHEGRNGYYNKNNNHQRRYGQRSYDQRRYNDQNYSRRNTGYAKNDNRGKNASRNFESWNTVSAKPSLYQESAKVWTYRNMQNYEVRKDKMYYFIFINGHSTDGPKTMALHKNDHDEKIRNRNMSMTRQMRNTVVLDGAYFAKDMQPRLLNLEFNDPKTNNSWKMLDSFIQCWSEYQKRILDKYNDENDPLDPICDWIYKYGGKCTSTHVSPHVLVIYNFSNFVVENFIERFEDHKNVQAKYISIDKADLKHSMDANDRSLTDEETDDYYFERVFSTFGEFFKYLKKLPAGHVKQIVKQRTD